MYATYKILPYTIHMKEKTSIRYFNKKPVRSRWDSESSSWLVCAIDLIDAVVETSNPRIYWYAIKRRNSELSTNCKQLKMTASDGKQYATDCLTNKGIDCLLDVLPGKQRHILKEWFKGNNDPLDKQSKKKAYDLIESGIINDIEIGTAKGLQQIHSYLFDGLYDFAGKIRNKNISKNGFMFANALYLPEILKEIDAMPEKTIQQIIDKYVEMNNAHPFMEGNGRSTRIWLNQILIRSLKKCVDWSKIDKNDYLEAMSISPSDPSKILKLISESLTDDFNNRELVIKGIDYSYYYEEIE
ncbi:MAG: Fic family protein [Bacilli bacterium]|nr:Fic family protein [Bacilli bacterium]